MTDASPGVAVEGDRIDLRVPRSSADRAFRICLIACASTVLVVITGIVIFLILRAAMSWNHFHLRLLTDPFSVAGRQYGFGGDLVGSLIIAVIALAVAAPISLATSLAINEYVPRAVRGPLIALIDLIAAVPSLIFGLWGIHFLIDHLHLTTLWFGHHASFFPLFRLDGSQVDGSLFDAGIVVGIMVIPLMTAISREVMSQVPRETCEAALALGGTKWGMVTDVILPFARNGIVGGAMLGLGRALGETIAVSLVLNPSDRLTSHILQPRGGSVSALIVRNFSSGGPLEQSALAAAGLTLFAVTLVVNIAARRIVRQGVAA